MAMKVRGSGSVGKRRYEVRQYRASESCSVTGTHGVNPGFFRELEPGKAAVGLGMARDESWQRQIFGLGDFEEKMSEFFKFYSKKTKSSY